LKPTYFIVKEDENPKINNSSYVSIKAISTDMAILVKETDIWDNKIICKSYKII